MNPLDHPIAFTLPRRLSPVRNWQEHTPFAMYLVSVLRPQTIVELGTHYGDSYCSFCQAVAELRLPTRCFAVDTWRGDAHAGTYGPEVLADLRGHHDALYSSFSELVQTTFDEAVELFEDGAIDLLHIDGYHTYEAVRHDFETWRPKLSERAVVLFHDSAERVGDFGVWRFIDELRADYPVFEFVHGHGLAVVFLGNTAVAELAQLPPDRAAAVRVLFAALGAGVRRAGAEQEAAAAIALNGRLDERLARIESASLALERNRFLRIIGGSRRPATERD